MKLFIGIKTITILCCFEKIPIFYITPAKFCSVITRSQEEAAKDYFTKVASYTRELDSTRPVTVVLNQVREIS